MSCHVFMYENLSLRRFIIYHKLIYLYKSNQKYIMKVKKNDQICFCLTFFLQFCCQPIKGTYCNETLVIQFFTK